jgi:hypothetical protein
MDTISENNNLALKKKNTKYWQFSIYVHIPTECTYHLMYMLQTGRKACYQVEVTYAGPQDYS